MDITRDILKLLSTHYPGRKIRFNVVTRGQKRDIIQKARIIGIEIYILTENETCYITEEDIVILSDIGFTITDGTKLFSRLNYREIDLSGVDTREMRSMDKMFSRSKASEIIVGGMNTSNVTTMEEAFGSITLNKLDIKHFDTRNVESMKYMFYNSKISELEMELNTVKVTDMEGMFEDSNIKNLNEHIKTFKTDRLEKVNMMFSCITERELDLRHFNFNKIKEAKNILQYATIDTLIMREDTLNINQYTVGGNIDRLIKK